MENRVFTVLKVLVMATFLIVGFQTVAKTTEPTIREVKGMLKLRDARAVSGGLEARSIEEVLTLPNDQIDLATAILLISKKGFKDLYRIDIDVEKYRQKVDEVATAILAKIGDKRSPEDIIQAVNHYLFKELNLSYISEHEDLRAPYLNFVLDTKKGNCWGTSILYLSIAERVALPLYAVIAPDHSFVRYADDFKKINIETVDGGKNYTDDFYVERHKIEKGSQFYLRSLTKKETIGLFLGSIGGDYANKGILDEAIALLNKAVEINPWDAGAHNNRGVAYWKKGQYDQAISDCTKALEIDPRLAEVYCNRGLTYREKGQLDLAIADYDKALELNPRYAKAYNNRGVAYDKKGQYDQAISDYNKALEIDPRYANAYYNRGLAYRKKGLLDHAILDCTKALEINPRDAETYNNRGLAYKNKGQLDQAISDYTNALEINPRYANAYYNRGLAYKNQGQLDQAISDYTNALEINPRYANAYYNRGLAYANKGQYDQAISDFDKALEINPGFPDASKNRQIAYEKKGQHDRTISDDTKAHRGEYPIRTTHYIVVGAVLIAFVWRLLKKPLTSRERNRRLKCKTCGSPLVDGPYVEPHGGNDLFKCTVKGIPTKVCPNGCPGTYSYQPDFSDEVVDAIDGDSENFAKGISCRRCNVDLTDIVTLVVAFGSLAVLIFGASWCRALDQLRVGVYALGLTLALILPVILLVRARLRARIAANAVVAERSRLMVPFKGTIGWTLISIIPLFFYSVSAVLIANRALDFSQPTCHETRWIKKYYTEGSGPSVVVQSWRSGRREEHFSISCFLYPELEQDSVIEVCTKKGWFGLEWVTSVRVVHQAVSDQTKALGTNPRNAVAYYNRGLAYANKGQLDQAISDYTKALEINPRHDEAYNNRGNAYSSKGQHDQAISDYSKALEINPRYANAYYNRGLAYANKGQLDQEISDYTKALEINPSFAEAYYNRGLAYANKGQLDQAISDYTKALEMNPRHDKAYNSRGIVYAKIGQLDQAISDYTKALEINPGNAAAYNNRGIAYFHNREYEKSWKDVEKARSLGYQIDPEFLDNLRKAYGRQN